MAGIGARVLGIMKDVNFGMRDCNGPVMWFEAKWEEDSGSLQILSWEQAREVIRESGVYNVEELEGKPCWLFIDESYVRFEKIAKL
jgi:hypothetical protein